MTFEDLDGLPLLIRRKDVARLTGWSDETLEGFVAEGKLTRVLPEGCRKGRYPKYEVMALAKIPYDRNGRVVRDPYLWTVFQDSPVLPGIAVKPGVPLAGLPKGLSKESLNES